MKFRKSCDICSVTFFTPNRNALYCAKCSKRMGVADPAAAPAPAGRTARAVVESGRGRNGFGATAEAVAERPRGPVLVKKKAKKGPRPPKPTELTTEIRQQIASAFAEANGENVAVRDLHASIAEKLWVRRWMVAEVIQDVNSVQVRLSQDQRAEVASHYSEMVEAHDRPAGGRRKAIAAKLNVPLKEVILAVRDWARKQEAESPTPRLSRQQLFDIEKAYWAEIDARRYKLDEFPERLAEQLGFANRWQVLRWIDVLHDDPTAFENVPDPAVADRKKIIETYVAYLEATAPPEKGLHQTISDGMGEGIKPRQIHKVLQNYRHTSRTKYSVKKK